jgi:hypothetical protein
MTVLPISRFGDLPELEILHLPLLILSSTHVGLSPLLKASVADWQWYHTRKSSQPKRLLQLHLPRAHLQLSLLLLPPTD